LANPRPITQQTPGEPGITDVQEAPHRKDETACLAALRELAVLDSAPEAEFDALVHVAAFLCKMPIALVSLVDSDRQWFKANMGLPGTAQTPLEVSFCALAVVGDGVFEVADASLDLRFADNPLVAGTLHPALRRRTHSPERRPVRGHGLRAGPGARPACSGTTRGADVPGHGGGTGA
jgi:hypothetical protein